jgi:ATP phosphoribosyltransferase regulatory subunit
MAERIPSGTRDVLPDEMRELRALSGRVRGVFDAAGYGEVYTPALEYGRTDGTEAAYRTVDEHGNVFVLRSDMTVPIARLAGTRYAHAELPLRFCYFAHSYRGIRTHRGQSREILQAGIELLGRGAPAGTLEVLTVLCDALDAAGLVSYRVGLGDAALYPRLLASVGVGAEDRAAILTALDAGDFVGVAARIAELGLGADDAELLARVPRLRGGPELLEGLDPRLADAATGLAEVHAALPERIADRVILDFGLLRNLGYYTGVLFQVYDARLGEPIGSGGRYDELLGQFGRPLPAVGFALNVEGLHLALAGEERSGA